MCCLPVRCCHDSSVQAAVQVGGVDLSLPTRGWHCGRGPGRSYAAWRPGPGGLLHGLDYSPEAVLDETISLTSDIPIDLACRIATPLVYLSEVKGCVYVSCVSSRCRRSSGAGIHIENAVFSVEMKIAPCNEKTLSPAPPSPGHPFSLCSWECEDFSSPQSGGRPRPPQRPLVPAPGQGTVCGHVCQAAWPPAAWTVGATRREQVSGALSWFHFG